MQARHNIKVKAKGDAMLKAEMAATKARERVVNKKAEQQVAQPASKQAIMQARHNSKVKAEGDAMLKAEMAATNARERVVNKVKAGALEVAGRAKTAVADTQKKVNKVNKEAEKTKAKVDPMLKVEVAAVNNEAAKKLAQMMAKEKAEHKNAAKKKVEQKVAGISNKAAKKLAQAMMAKEKAAQNQAEHKKAEQQVAQPASKQAIMQARHNIKVKAKGDAMLKADMAATKERERVVSLRVDKLMAKQHIVETHHEHEPESVKGLGNLMRTVTAQNKKFQHEKHEQTLGSDFVISALKNSHANRKAQKEVLSGASGIENMDNRLKVGPEGQYKQLKDNLEKKSLLKKVAIQKAEKEHEVQVQTARSQQAQSLKPTPPKSEEPTSTAATAQNTEVDSKVHSVAQEKLKSDAALHNMENTVTKQVERKFMMGRKSGPPKLGSKEAAADLNHVTQQSASADRAARQKFAVAAAARKVRKTLQRAAQLQDAKAKVISIKQTKKQEQEKQRDLEHQHAAQLARLNAKWTKEDNDKKFKKKFDSAQTQALKAAEVAAAHEARVHKQASLTEAKVQGVTTEKPQKPQKPVPHTLEEKQAALQTKLKKLRAAANEKQEAWLKIAADTYHDKAYKLAKLANRVKEEKREHQMLHHVGLIGDY